MNIVDRCRGWHKPGEAITGDVQLYLDAANEIERLRAELDEVYEANGKLAYLASQNDRLRAENASLGETLATLELDNHKLRATLLNLYNLFSKSNDFRSDSGPARDARAALNEETK